jgi:hypothetical protein
MTVLRNKDKKQKLFDNQHRISVVIKLRSFIKHKACPKSFFTPVSPGYPEASPANSNFSQTFLPLE